MRSVEKDFWYKPKTHGYGAYPTNWKGWVLIAAYIVAIPVVMSPLVVEPALNNQPPTIAGVALSLAALAVVTWIFLRAVRAKTDGEWRWRWGDRKET